MAEVSSQTLHLVARELTGELNEARTALEAFGEQQDNIILLRKCDEHLHSVHGALRLAEVYGAALLAEEMGQLTRYLLDNFGEKRHLNEGLDALMRAMVQLPTYLERVVSGGRDMALVLLPLLNDLRAVRGNALLSEGTLLLLNLRSDQQANPLPPGPGEGGMTVPQWARKLRGRFQVGLLGWIKGERIEQNLEALSSTAEKLEQLATTQAVFQLWWVVGAVVEALRDGGLEGSASIKRLLGQADRDLKRLYEQGETRYSDAPSLQLMNNLLYYVARAKSGGPRVSAVRASFRLSELLPVDDQVEQARESLSAPSVKLMKTVAGAIKEDLGRVKDALDIFVRQGGKQVEELNPQIEMLRKIGDTLGVLGLGELRDKVQTETGDLQAIVSQKAPVSESALLRMAATLIRVEDSLDEQLVGMIVPTDDGGGERQTTADDVEFRQVTEAVLRECIVNMARIKEAIALSMEKPREPQIIEQIPALVRGITAGLLLLGKPRVVEIMEGIARALSQFGQPDGMTLPQEAVDRLADAIVAVEYYMETLQAGRTDPWYMLDNAETCLTYLADIQPVSVDSQQALDPIRTVVIEPLSQTVVSPTEYERTAVISPGNAPGRQSVAPRQAANAGKLAAREIDPEFLPLFIEEAKDELGKLRRFFPSWDANPNDQEALTNVRRSFHTLKGSGRMVGAQLIGDFAWAIENLLNRVINKTLDRNPDIMDLLRAAVAAVPELIEQLETNRLPQADIGRVIGRAEELAAPPRPASSAASNAAPMGRAATRRAAAAAAAQPTPPTLVPVLPQQASTSGPASAAAAEKKTAPAPLPAVAPMDPVLHEIFAKETAGHLAEIRKFIADSKLIAAPYPVTEDLHRSCHTLSGTAKTAGARQGIKITEPLNRYVRKLYDNAVGMPVAGLEALAESVSAIQQVVDHINEDTGFFVSHARLVKRLIDLDDALDDEISRLAETMDVASAMQEEEASFENVHEQHAATVVNLETAGVPSAGEAEQADADTSADASEIVEFPSTDANTLSLLQWSFENLQQAEAAALPAEPASTNFAPRTDADVDEFNGPAARGSGAGHAQVIETATWGADFEPQVLPAIEPLSVPGFNEAAAFDSSSDSDFGLAAFDQPSFDRGAAFNATPAFDQVASFNEPAFNEPAFSGALARAGQAQPSVFGEQLVQTFAAESWPEDSGFAAASAVVPVTVQMETELAAELIEDDSPFEAPFEAPPAAEAVGQGMVAIEVADHDASDDLEDFGAPAESFRPPAFDARSFEPEPLAAEPFHAAPAHSQSFDTAHEVPDHAPVPSLEPSVAHGAAPGMDAATDDDGEADQDTDFDAEVAAIFTDEATELLEVADGALSSWMRDHGNTALVFELKRVVHTLKGGARMAGLRAMGDLSHELETLMQLVEAGQVPPEPHVFAALQASLDELNRMRDVVSQGGRCIQARQLMNRIRALAAGELIEAPPVQAPPPVQMVPSPPAQMAAPVPVPPAPVVAPPMPVAPPPAAVSVVEQEEFEQEEFEQEELEQDRLAEDLLRSFEPEPEPEPEPESELLEAALAPALEETVEVARFVEEVPDEDFDPAGTFTSTIAAEDLTAIAPAPVIEESVELSEEIELSEEDEPLAEGSSDFDDLIAEEVVLSSEEEPLPELLPELLPEPVAPMVAPAAHAATAIEPAAQPLFQPTFVPEPPVVSRAPAPVEAPAPFELPRPALRPEPPRFVPELVESRPRPQEIAAQASEAAGEPQQSVVSAITLPPGREQVTQERQEFARVDADLLDTLLNNAGEVSIFRSRLEQQVNLIDSNLGELGRTVTRLKDQLRKIEMETEAQILHRHQEENPGRTDFDPLEMDRYSSLQQLTRAFAESVSDVSSIEGLVASLTRDAQTLLLQQSRVVTEMQNGLMRTRMVPFQRHVQRLSRLVRQVATETGKRAELVVSGATGELDRQVLERMLPPFEHMLRNSVVHGIEAPQDRLDRGKPANGTINVGLHREGSEMVIVLQDDGRGIDVNAVRERARSRGIIKEGRMLSDEEAMQLILEPGFSTASAITQHAGRGVGMDVVVTEIKKLGGSLLTESTVGQGVKFTIRLPFTLAITQALIVRTGEELYALPLQSVEGVVRIQRSEVEKYLGEEAPSFTYGGQVYRFQHLGAFIGGSPSVLPEADVAIPIMLIRAGEHSTALVTDELVGTREMVVKAVGPQIATIRGISGATIMGDGRIVIILDMNALVRAEWRNRAPVENQGPKVDRRTFALVVDDSITVRRVTQRFLERSGMRVMTAKDGVDALSILQEHLPDVILLDVEMPRMDGYELTSLVRADARLSDIPIVMITSRVGEKHRARALEVGVNDYLGKPYQESQLLDAIEPLVEARRRRTG